MRTDELPRSLNCLTICANDNYPFARIFPNGFHQHLRNIVISGREGVADDDYEARLTQNPSPRLPYLNDGRVGEIFVCNRRNYELTGGCATMVAHTQNGVQDVVFHRLHYRPNGWQEHILAGITIEPVDRTMHLD